MRGPESKLSLFEGGLNLHIEGETGKKGSPGVALVRPVTANQSAAGVPEWPEDFQRDAPA